MLHFVGITNKHSSHLELFCPDNLRPGQKSRYGLMYQEENLISMLKKSGSKLPKAFFSIKEFILFLVINALHIFNIPFFMAGLNLLFILL